MAEIRWIHWTRTFRLALMKTVMQRRQEAVRNEFIIRHVPINGDPNLTSAHRPLCCPRCGTTWRVTRGLCVNCLLSCGLEDEMYDGQTLNDVLDLIDVNDAD